MRIDKVGQIEPILNTKKPGRAEQARSVENRDTISISREGYEMAELLRVAEMAKAAPDANAGRIAELRAKINDPSYINDTVLRATADSIMNAFNI